VIKFNFLECVRVCVCLWYYTWIFMVIEFTAKDPDSFQLERYWHTNNLKDIHVCERFESAVSSLLVYSFLEVTVQQA